LSIQEWDSGSACRRGPQRQDEAVGGAGRIERLPEDFSDISKTPHTTHRIDHLSPNFGRSVEPPSLTGVIILACPVALAFSMNASTGIPLLRRGNAFYQRRAQGIHRIRQRFSRVNNNG
jgi:hypothetical protein